MKRFCTFWKVGASDWGVLMLWLEEAWKAHPAPSWVLPTESLRCTSAVLLDHRTEVARPEYVQG